MIKYIGMFRLVLRCLLVARKKNSTGFSTGLTSWLKNLDPTGNPTGRSTRPVSISAPPPDPRASGSWELRPQTPSLRGFRPQIPKTAPLLISGYAPRSHKGYVLFVCCRPAPNSGQKIGLSLSEDLFFSFFFFT